jgi:transposase
MALDPKQLPGELEACHALITQLAQELDLRDLKVRQLQHQLEQLLRWRYGRKSERVDEHQMFFEAMALVNAATAPASDTPSAAPAQESTATPAAAPSANPRGHGRQRLPAHLPRERIVYDVPEEQRHCPHCSEAVRHIGEELCERLEYVPASLKVIQEACQKYACSRGCTVITAEKPMAPIEKGLPGPGLMAHVTVNKYADHLPLARQQGMFRRQGVELARSTMCDWMRRGAELLSPLYQLMTQRVLSSKAVQTDDTPVAVFDPDLSHTRQGRIWSYVGDPANPFTVYAYTPTRAGEGPSAFLENYSGYLQADAYAGYDAIFNDNARDILELACWAHARRRFFEAQTSDLMRSMIVLAYVRLLYDVEREAKDAECTGEARRVL